MPGGTADARVIAAALAVTSEASMLFDGARLTGRCGQSVRPPIGMPGADLAQAGEPVANRGAESDLDPSIEVIGVRDLDDFARLGAVRRGA